MNKHTEQKTNDRVEEGNKRTSRGGLEEGKKRGGVEGAIDAAGWGRLHGYRTHTRLFVPERLASDARIGHI